MTGGGPIVDVTGLSQPATTLINRISDAIGAVFLPRQIKRVAKAEVEAEKIRVAGQVEVTEIQRRALIRLIEEEGKKQANIESITAQALPALAPDAKPEGIDGDWLAYFFEKARLVSDAEMQRIWARILASEGNRPGAFSKRTIELVSSLSKGDAELFTSLCRFDWLVGERIIPIVFDHHARIYCDEDINFESLTHLDDIGLITFTPNEIVTTGLPKQLTIFYFGEPLTIEFPEEENNALDTGRAILTEAGRELAAICGAEKVTSDTVLDTTAYIASLGATAPAPEPGTLALLAAGLAGVGALRRRKVA